MIDKSKKRTQPLVRNNSNTVRKQKLTRKKTKSQKLNKQERLNKNIESSLRTQIFLNEKISKINEIFGDSFIDNKLNELKDLNNIENIWNIPLHSQIKKINSLIDSNENLDKIKTKLIKEFFILDSIRKHDYNFNKYNHLEGIVKQYFEDSINNTNEPNIEDKTLFTSNTKTIIVSFLNLNIVYTNNISKTIYTKDIDIHKFNLSLFKEPKESSKNIKSVPSNKSGKKEDLVLNDDNLFFIEAQIIEEKRLKELEDEQEPVLDYFKSLEKKEFIDKNFEIAGANYELEEHQIMLATNFWKTFYDANIKSFLEEQYYIFSEFKVNIKKPLEVKYFFKRMRIYMGEIMKKSPSFNKENFNSDNYFNFIDSMSSTELNTYFDDYTSFCEDNNW